MTGPHDTSSRAGGWTFSCLLHALCIGTAVVLAAEFSVIPREKPFQWEVSLVTASESEPISSDLPTPVPAASIFHQVRSDAGSPRSNPLETTTHEMITASSPIGAAPSDLPSHELPRKHAAGPPSLFKKKTPQEAPLPPEITPPDPSAPHDEHSVTSPQLTALFPVMEVVSAEIPPPEVDASEQSLLASEPSIQEPIRVVNRPSPQYHDAALSRELHADYGWLAQVLFKKIEQLKRYPHTAKRRRLEGNVLLQAMVREDGRVEEITIFQSSGHPTLDQDAIATLERASPISLKYPLGQPNIVVQLPIGYHLE